MPEATAGATAVSSAASGAGGCGALRGGRGGRRGRLRRGGRELLHLLLRQRAAQVRHRPARGEHLRRRVLGGDEHELALLQRADRRVERVDVGSARGGAEAFEHARLVVLRLQAADEPGAGVRHRLVVEVDGVLRREDETEPERAALLEDRQDRLLRGGCRRRRHVAGDLVHVRERAQVGRARLPPHPRHELPEDERRHEHALVVREVRECRRSRRAASLRREEERLRVERRALVPRRERGRGDEGVQLQRQLGAVLGREEGVDLEDAELAERRRLHLADQRPEVEALPGAPGVLDQVREQHVLAARERVGCDADEPEQARHRALDLVPQRLRLGVPRELRRGSEPITFSGTPADEPGV